MTTMKMALGLILFGLLSSCSDTEGAARTLHAHGYTNIRVKGFGMGCGQDYYYSTKFTALPPNGNRYVTGVVCRGMYGASVIKTYN